MSGAGPTTVRCQSHRAVALTDRESLIRMEVADPRITRGRYHAQTGKGTASSTALGLLLECTSMAAPGIFSRGHLHVVRHDRGRHDGTIGSAWRHKHHTSIESAAQALRPAAQAL